MDKVEMDKPSKYDIKSALENYRQRMISFIPGNNDVDWLKERIYELSNEEIDPHSFTGNYWNDGEERDNYDEEGIKVIQETKPNIHKKKAIANFR